MCSFCWSLYFWMRISLLAYKKGERCHFFLHLFLLKNISSYLLLKAHIALARVIRLTVRQFLFHKICLLIKLLTWQRSLFILQLLQSKKGLMAYRGSCYCYHSKKRRELGPRKHKKAGQRLKHKNRCFWFLRIITCRLHLSLSFQSQGKDETASFNVSLNLSIEQSARKSYKVPVVAEKEMISFFPW